MKYLSLVWSGIWRKKGRAALMVLQIAVAFVLFGLLQGMKTGIDDATKKVSADLYIVQPANGNQPLPLAMYNRIQSVPGVRSVSYQNLVVGTYQKPTQIVFAVATEVESSVATTPGLVVPPQAIAAMKRTRTGCVISRELAAKYDWKVGDRIPLQSRQVVKKDGSRDWAFDVVGFFDPGDQSTNKEFMIINHDYFDEARRDSNGTVQAYYVRVTDVHNGVAVAKSIDNLFANSSDEVRTESLKDMAQSNLQQIGDLNFIIRAVVGAVLFALLFSISAMIMQSIRERTPELAVLKTVGFSDHKVFWLILIEALLLCVGAAVIGLGLASLILPGATKIIQLQLSMPSSVIGIGVAMAVALALIGAVIPAWRGLRLQPAAALAGR